MAAALTLTAASSASSSAAMLLSSAPRCAATHCLLAGQRLYHHSSLPSRSVLTRVAGVASSAHAAHTRQEPPVAGPSASRWASSTAAAASASPATTTSRSASSPPPSAVRSPHLTSVPDPSGRFDLPGVNVDPASSSASKSASAPPPVAPAAETEQKPAASEGKPAPRRANRFRAQRAPITLTPSAVERLRDLIASPTDPRLIRISVRNKGCAGMSYHLEYVKPDEADKFDERVKQDDVTVLIDSKALFSIIGSEMDWKEDRLSAKFVFNNPMVVSCGCGESFAVK
ncbi:Iron-sulfur assembly protein 1 [Tilletia horrida]|uniref:Iron-sulfur assembly protein 1 n=1 Tax=Tilletia horrida TaxID=155126 RepID=A0AAN6JSV7_9BASI|nr:Iron-sulfur assembly protein 1 [Tilletia horrida]KAK0539036.1 Iron-sulfur assembly protein 1 [Tilletia horrida]KAK0541469.1 Iron-sulfur assembly protein 1 [Tilletia horrida]KAK0567851.1 Iron-sulfur assembly protein 1 [Tilletia horrida]